MPDIGKDGDHPSWDDIVGASSIQNFLGLAMRSERQREEGGDAVATSSELRLVRHSIEEYLEFKRNKRFGANTNKNSSSVLERAKDAPVPKNPEDENRTFGDRRVAGVTRSDADGLIATLSTIENPKESTLQDYRKQLHAWFE